MEKRQNAEADRHFGSAVGSDKCSPIWQPDSLPALSQARIGALNRLLAGEYCKLKTASILYESIQA